MGTRGPVAKANRRAALAHATTPPTRTTPEAPKGLDRDRAALWARLWDRCPWLDPDLDREAVLRYLDDLLEREDILEELAVGGRTSTGSMGQLTTSPLVAQLRQVNTELGQLEAALGITSAARTRQGVEIPKPAPSMLIALTRDRTTPQRDPREVDIDARLRKQVK